MEFFRPRRLFLPSVFRHALLNKAGKNGYAVGQYEMFAGGLQLLLQNILETSAKVVGQASWLSIKPQTSYF
jgi:hypothetical protein